MKINDAARAAQLLQYQKNAPLREKQGTDKPASPRDGVSISQAALDLAHGVQEGADPARLSAVKQAIQNGTYQVDADLVVQKILAAYGEA